MSGIELDLELTRSGLAQDSGNKSLNTVLPKLARRITQNQSQRKSSSPYAKNNDNDDYDDDEAVLRKQRAQRNTRRSVTGSICFKPAEPLPPEVEQLRSRDINPDADSAAEKALNAAAAFAQAAENGDVSSLKRNESSGQKVEGREILQDHAQYALTYGMMLGIRVTTGRRDINLDDLARSKSLSAYKEQELSHSDYQATTKLTFPPTGSTLPPFPTPPHKLPFTFHFKDYSPNVFRAIRALSDIDEADYMLSLAGDFNYIEFIANSKSGQFFFYSHDGKYMIKTQTKEESKLLRRMLPAYLQHLTDHPDSLLVRFYGLYRVKMKSLRSKTFFVIMSSVFDTSKSIQIKYDLKGSTVGRLTNEKDCIEGSVQKDLNLMSSGRRVKLGSENIDIFYETLRADVMFLKELNIMDYSLLLGIHEVNKDKERMRRRSSGVVLARASVKLPSPSHHHQGGGLNRTPSKLINTTKSIFQSYYGGIKSVDGNEIYFLGIIDILQLYNASKMAENFFKGFQYDRRQLSAVDPTLYAERMLDFVMRHTDYPQIMATRKQNQRQGGGAAPANSAPNSNTSGSSTGGMVNRQRKSTQETEMSGGSGRDNANLPTNSAPTANSSNSNANGRRKSQQQPQQSSEEDDIPSPVSRRNTPQQQAQSPPMPPSSPYSPMSSSTSASYSPNARSPSPSKVKNMAQQINANPSGRPVSFDGRQDVSLGRSLPRTNSNGNVNNNGSNAMARTNSNGNVNASRPTPQHSHSQGSSSGGYNGESPSVANKPRRQSWLKQGSIPIRRSSTTSK